MATSRTAMQELPGFIWDEEKRRYVKILTDHHANALGDAAKTASASAVKDALTLKKRRREEEVQAASIAEVQVRRSRIHKHAVVGMTLAREAGALMRNVGTIHGNIWAHLVEPGWTAPVSCCSSSWYMMQKTMQNDAFVGILHDGSASTCLSSKLAIIFTDPHGGQSRVRPSEDSFGRVSSMNLTKKFAFVTTFRRHEPNKLFEISMGEGEKTEVPHASYSISKANVNHDYWCASFHPDLSRPRIAVGSEHSILVHNPFCSHGHGLIEYKRPASSSPALCIRWKSEHVIAAAFRDATVHLYDVRARDDVLRLRHSQAVMRLHCPDENKVLLGGPKQLSMYDLRYNRPPSHKQHISRPWLHYHNYDNTRWNVDDMDISPRLGLLALALEATTELWNLWTGEKLRQLQPPKVLRNSVDKSNVVSFTRPHHRSHFSEDEEDPTGILVGGLHSALEWHLNADVSDKPPDVLFDNVVRQDKCR